MAPTDMIEMARAAAAQNNLEWFHQLCRVWADTFPGVPSDFGNKKDKWVALLWSAAHEAGMNRRPRIVQWLIEEKGVPVHRLTAEEAALITAAPGAAGLHQTPLASAVYGGDVAIVRYLLREGAARGDIDLEHDCRKPRPGFRPYTLLELALESTKGEASIAAVVRVLLEEGGLDPRSVGEPTLLAVVTMRGMAAVVEVILAWARKAGLLPAALRDGLHPKGSAPPLIYAVVASRQLELLQRLVATTPELQHDEKAQLGTVSLAANMAFLPALRFLLAPERAREGHVGPFDVNWNAYTRRTLLHCAVEPYEKRRGPKKTQAEVAAVVAFLLEQGADPTLLDQEGHTPIQVARRWGYHEAAKLMEAAACKEEREAAARAAEAELLGLLEQEEAKGKGKKQQQKKGKKGKGKGGGGEGKSEGDKPSDEPAAAVETAATAAAKLAALSLADSDDDDDELNPPPVASNDVAAATAATATPAEAAAAEPPLGAEEAFILARAQAEAPDFVCPLSGRLMREVALASDGFSYERAAIEAHIRRRQDAGRVPESPTTGEPLDPMLLPNLSLRNLIAAFVAEQRRAFLSAAETKG